jgi:hypothetical protein
LVKFTQIRRTFERARIASEQVMKREKLKLQVLEEDEQFASKMKPSLYIMRETLDKLVEKDHEKVSFEIQVILPEILYRQYYRNKKCPHF